MPPNVPIVGFGQPQQKESALDKIIKGLSVANQLTGTIANVSQLGARNRLVEAQTKLAEAKASNVGVLDPKTRATLANIESQIGQRQRDEARAVKSDARDQIAFNRESGVDSPRELFTAAGGSQPSPGGVLPASQAQNQGVLSTPQPREGVLGVSQPAQPTQASFGAQISGEKPLSFDEMAEEVNARLDQQAPQPPNLNAINDPNIRKIKEEEFEVESKQHEAKKSELFSQLTVLGNINKARDFIENNPSATGLFGQVGAFIGGSRAKALNAVLLPIKSSLALGKLQDLKKSSSSGASGFGALSEKELALISSEVANLENDLPPDVLLDGLDTVEKKFSGMLERAYKVKIPKSGKVGAPGPKQTGQSTQSPSNNIVQAGDDGLEKLSDEELIQLRQKFGG